MKLKRTLAVVMVAAMLPIMPLGISAEDTSELLVNDSFDSYVTNERPGTYRMYVNEWGIQEYAVRNKGMYAEAKGDGSQMCVDIKPVTNAVISFDLMATDKMPSGSVNVKDADGNERSIITFTEGNGAKSHNGLSITGYGNKKAVNYAIVFRSADNSYDLYVNGSCKQKNVQMSSDAIGDVVEVNFVLRSDKEKQGVIIDNLNIYESDTFSIREFPRNKYNSEVLGNLDKNNKAIDVTTDKTIFESDAPYKTMLEGYTAIHATSGVVTVNGNKTVLDNTPIKTGVNEFLLPAQELGEVLNVFVAVDGEKVNFNGIVIEGEVRDGVTYVKDTDAINTFAGVISRIPSTYNANGYIIGADAFAFPHEQSEIDALNDYVMYYRPTPAQFTELYNESGLAGVHPRIQFTQSDFDRMLELSKTDETVKAWAQQIITEADAEMKNPLPVWELYDGTRLGAQRPFAKAIHALALAYYLTGDMKYVDRAYEEMEVIANFKNWNPSHHLDTCEMMAGYAVGYDWLYNAFTPEQRKVIEEGMYNNGFYDSYLGYISESSPMGGAFYMTNNHGTVDNAGVLMAAVAMMDVYPEEAAWLGSNAVRGMELTIYKWAPEGVWYEGAGYWELTMQFTAKFLSTLRTAFKTDLGFNNLEGMELTVASELQNQTNVGVYNFADSTLGKVYVPEMFYIANVYGLAGVHKAVIDAVGEHWGNAEDAALAMLWYDPELAKSDATLDTTFEMKSIDTISMRNSWDTTEPAYVGIHAGKTRLEHSQLDGGSFIFDHSGVRWAMEMGMGDYNADGYWNDAPGGGRWKIYRSRAEAHNTLFTSPTAMEDHVVDSNAELTIVENKPRGVIATVDMTELLYDTEKATRGFAFADNRETLTVRDEITLAKETDVVWTMITEADAVIDEANQTITLTQNGREMKLYYRTSSPAEVTYGPAQSLPTSPQQTTETQFKMIRIRMNGVSGNQAITVKLTSSSLAYASDIEEWNCPISEWSIPEGEIPEKPAVDYITAGDWQVAAGNSSSVVVTVSEADYATPPQISVASDKYDVEIIQASSYDESGKVTLTDKNDPTNVSIYTVVFDVIYLPAEFDGMTSIPVRKFEVSATPQAENPGINMFDGDRSTRWAADGAGNWIELDLGDVQQIDNIVMSFMSGHVRQQKLTFSISDDGENWTQIWEGMSCGTTEDLEFFPTGGVNARYVKIGCNGNTQGGANWNSVTELLFTRNN